MSDNQAYADCWVELEQVKAENAHLRAQLEQEQHRVAMLQEVIKNIGGALDANQKSWFEMEAEAAAMRDTLAQAGEHLKELCSAPCCGSLPCKDCAINSARMVIRQGLTKKEVTEK